MSEPQSYGEKFAQGVHDKKESFTKRGPEKGEQRAQAIGETWKKGVDFFKGGINSVREKISKIKEGAKEVGATVASGAKETGVAILGAPEFLQDSVDAGVLNVKESVAEAALWADKTNDRIADKWDDLTARGTGAVESGIQNLQAGRTEAAARAAESRTERYTKRKESGRADIESALKEAEALVLALKTQLEVADGPDPKMDDLEAKKNTLVKKGEDFRVEAKQRKGNGKSLGKLRGFMSGAIATKRFN